MPDAQTIVLESRPGPRAANLEPAEELWERISLLHPADRILLELYFRARASYRQIGRIVNRPPGSVNRAIRRLGRRLHDPLVLTLLHPDCPLDPVYRQIGVEHFLSGLPVPQLARQHDLPAARVRRIVHFVRSWHRGLAARGGAPRGRGG